MCAPTVGRTVLFRIGTEEDAVRPAVVVRVWSPGNPESSVQLQVFVDGMNDQFKFTPAERSNGLAWRTSVPHGNGVGEWSWPPRLDQKPAEEPTV